jgi:uncharacterized membrane protein YhiD involved in acid resistance
MPVTSGTIEIGYLKDVLTIVGLAAAGLISVGTCVWWFRTQISDVSRELHDRVSKTNKEFSTKIDHNKDDCRDTKEKVAMLSLSHEHHEKKMEEVEETLRAMKHDITATKDAVVEQSQKAREDTLMIMGEIRSMEGRGQLANMELKESFAYMVSTLKEAQHANSNKG